VKATPTGVLRAVVLLSGAVAGVVFVHALDEGLARSARPFGAGHLAAGISLAAAVMPGPLLGVAIGAASSERARGLAFGGSAVTAFVALLGGAMLLARWGREGAEPRTVLGLAWCALALPLAALDAWSVRVGAGDPPGDGPHP
jgi:hypothetical protein